MGRKKPNGCSGSQPENFVFLLLEGFTHLALSASLEVLRVANLLSGRTLYTWQLMGEGGASCRSSNGLRTELDLDLSALLPGTELFLVSGVDAENIGTKGLYHYLRDQDRHGVHVGSLCSGAVLLAEAGLLNEKTATVHWHYYPLFREKFARTILSRSAFHSSSRPYSASGGTAGGELMLHMVRESYGDEFALQVADQLVLPALRSEHSEQRMPYHIRYGTRNQLFLGSVGYMHANLEEPLSSAEIAEFLGISVRQLERIFRRVLGESPTRHYRRIRLEAAKNLLETTDMSVLQIAIATGFSSASHFSKVFRAEYGSTPFATSRTPM